MRSLRVLLVAEEGAGVAMLRALTTGPHQLVAILTTEPRNGAQGTTPWDLAQTIGCRTIAAITVKDPGLVQFVRDERVDILLNVHSLYLIPEGLLRAPRIGAFNLHPGPLPRYAGLNAPSWAIYHDEVRHGVTIHHMTPGIDAGPVAYQKLFPITGTDTGFSLSARCVREGLPLLSRLLDDAAEAPDSIPRIEQDRSQRTYFGRDVPQDGVILWSKFARDIFNFIRAACYHPFPSPWGHPRAFLNGREFGIVTASLSLESAGAAPGTIVRQVQDGALIACADGCILAHRIHLDGRYSNAAEHLKPGDVLEHAPQLVHATSRSTECHLS